MSKPTEFLSAADPAALPGEGPRDLEGDPALVTAPGTAPDEPGQLFLRRRPPRSASAQRCGLPLCLKESAVHVLARATVLGSWDRARHNRTLADLVITQDVRGFPLPDFSALPVLVKCPPNQGNLTLLLHVRCPAPAGA